MLEIYKLTFSLYHLLTFKTCTIVLCALIYTNQALAREIPLNQKIDSVRTSLNFFNIQEPSLDTAERKMWTFSFRKYFENLEHARVDSTLYIAPDDLSESTSLDIQQDFYLASVYFSLEFVNLFRYSLGFGPIFIYEKTNFKFKEENVSTDHMDYGLSIKGQVDYAITEMIEVQLSLGFQNRVYDKKSDWLYGVGVGFNI